jgi:hypothetical protein
MYIFLAMVIATYVLPMYVGAIVGLAALTGLIMYLWSRGLFSYKKPVKLDAWLVPMMAACAYAYLISIVVHAPKNVTSSISSVVSYTVYVLIGLLIVNLVVRLRREGKGQSYKAQP